MDLTPAKVPGALYYLAQKMSLVCSQLINAHLENCNCEVKHRNKNIKEMVQSNKVNSVRRL